MGPVTMPETLAKTKWQKMYGQVTSNQFQVDGSVVAGVHSLSTSERITMKTPQFVLCGLGAALVCLGPIVTTVRAQSFSPLAFVSEERLNVKLTALIQGETVDIERNGESIGTRDEAPTRVRIDNKALLQVYGAPAGSRLVLLNGSEIGYKTGSSDAVDTGISLSLDTPFVLITKGQHTEVSGDTTSVSKSNYIAQYIANPMLESFSVPENPFDITGFTFSFVGMTKETVNQKETETETASKHTTQHTFSFSGAGNGTIITTEATSDVVVSGKISSSGKETETAD